MKNKKGLVIGFVSFLVVIALAVGYLVYAGFIVINANPSKGSAASSCSGEVLDRFNTVAGAGIDSAESFKDRGDKLATLATEVRQNPEHTTDSTCSFIVLSSALASFDEPLAKEYLGHLKAAVNDGRFVDTRASGLVSLEVLQLHVNSLSIDAGNTEAALGSG